jgi:hypothetical protein
MTKLPLPALLVAAIVLPGLARAQGSASPLAGVSRLGPEGDALSRRTGRWIVTETDWDHPGAAPVINSKLVADRQMIGRFLQETLLAAGDAAARPKRMDYLGYDSVDGTTSRWKPEFLWALCQLGALTAASPTELL